MSLPQTRTTQQRSIHTQTATRADDNEFLSFASGVWFTAGICRLPLGALG